MLVGVAFQVYVILFHSLFISFVFSCLVLYSALAGSVLYSLSCHSSSSSHLHKHVPLLCAFVSTLTFSIFYPHHSSLSSL